MKVISESGIRTSALLVILLLSIFVWADTRSPYAVQMKNMALARIYVDAVQPCLENVGDFQDVMIGLITASNGAILVHGRVSSEQIKNDVKDFLQERNPPRPLIIRFIIDEPIDEPQ